MDTHTALGKMRPLTQDERMQARQNARDAVRTSYGHAPDHAEYIADARLRITSMDAAIWVLCIVVLLAAFALSAMRLFYIGRETFMHSIPDETSAVVGGLAIVILAELTQLISALALARVKDARFRRTLHAVGWSATAIAIVGNVQVVRPWLMDGAFTFLPDAFQNIFAWLEAIAPPCIVLAMAHVLKHQIIDAFAEQENAKDRYNSALQEWQRKMDADAETHPEWKRFYATALRDKLRSVNARSNNGKEVIPTLTNADWSALAWREMQADDWYNEPVTPVIVQPEPPVRLHDAPRIALSPAPKASRTGASNGNGQSTDEVIIALQNAVHTSDGIVVRCPHCAYEITKQDADSARMALTAHVGRWCKARQNARDAVRANGNGHHEA